MAIIFALLKGVPAKTTRVVTVGGVLRREEMDIVMNPHDEKAIEAADYVKRKVGGKVIAVTMGPEVKLSPIVRNLYDKEIEGVDETVILSDRRMAGADTLATSYAVCMGIKKVLENHQKAIDELVNVVDHGAGNDELQSKATSLYKSNMIPNLVFTILPSIKSTIIRDYVSGVSSKEKTKSRLEEVRKSILKFMVLAGIKTSDGETGSVGPQVAEGLSDVYGFEIPHLTYVHDFDIDPEKASVSAERKVGTVVQVLEAKLPMLLTISPDYIPRVPPASLKKGVRINSYKGKVRQSIVWNADFIGADPMRIGLAGSPTLVGPGVEVGKPPTQKYLNKTLVFAKPLDELSFEGKKYGPFEEGDQATGLPEGLVNNLIKEGLIIQFTYPRLVRELFGGLRGRS